MYGNGCSRGVVRYSDVIMSTVMPQITAAIVHSTVCSGADQRKHQSSASLAFVRGIHRWPANSPHKGPVTRKIFRHHGHSCERRASYWQSGNPGFYKSPLYKYIIFIFTIFSKFKYLQPSFLPMMPCIQIAFVLFLSGLMKWSSLVMNL